MAESRVACCGNCPFFLAANDKGGVCRKNPPHPMIVGGQPDPLVPQRIVPMINAYWPAVGVSDWCGSHPLFGVDQIQTIDRRLAADAEGKA